MFSAPLLVGATDVSGNLPPEIKLDDPTTWPSNGASGGSTPTSIVIDESTCMGKECKHIITGTLPQADRKGLEAFIQVKGGEHNIILKDAVIELADNQDYDVHVRAFALDPDVKVNLKLEGNNKLKSAGSHAAVHVPSSATLNISSESKAKLEAISNGTNSAGIGGDDTEADCGDITIDVTKDSEIIAQGGKYAAGIGSGGHGTAGTIEIHNGIVSATGGMGGVGIGSDPERSDSVNNKIIISGGDVRAYGGLISENSTDRKSGISCKTLDSDKKSVTLTSTNGIYGNTGGFNGIVWGYDNILDKDKDKYLHAIVYGNAILRQSIEKNYRIDVPRNTTLTCIPPITNNGIISGNGILIDSDKLTPGPDVDEDLGIEIPISKRKCDLEKDYISLKCPYTCDYTGTDMAGALIDDNIKKSVDRNGRTYQVNTDGWNRTIKKGTKKTSGITDAGTYRVYYEREGIGNFDIGPITVREKDLSDPSVKVEIEGEYNYTGEQLNPKVKVSIGEHELIRDGLDENGNPIVDEKGNEIEGDYTVIPPKEGENIAAGKEAGIVTISYGKSGNCTGQKEVHFDINQASIESASVTLGEVPVDITYDGNDHKLAPYVTLGDKELVLGTDYTVSYTSVTTGKPVEDFSKADTIKVTVTAIEDGNYTGSASASPTYEIKKKGLTITKFTPDKTREYDVKEDGINDKINVTADTASLNTVVPGDTVTFKSQAILVKPETFGDLKQAGEVSELNEYQAIIFDEATLNEALENGLIGNDADNYMIEGLITGTPLTLESGMLSNAITITPFIPEAPELDKPALDDNKLTNLFKCTLKVKERPDPRYQNLIYQYRMKKADDEAFEDWAPVTEVENPDTTKSYTFEDIPKGKYIFEVRSVDPSGNVAESNPASTGVVDIDLLPESSIPEGFTLELSDTADEETETYTALIKRLDPSIISTKKVEYAFVKIDEEAAEIALPTDEDFSENNRCECEAASKYRAYVRYASTPTRKAGTPVLVTNGEFTTDPLKVKTPVVSFYKDENDNTDDTVILGDYEYRGSAKCQITCGTQKDGVKIYYSTDGSDPLKGIEYKGEEPIDLRKYENENKEKGTFETRIRAIATKDSWYDSEEIDVTFTRQLPPVEAPKLTISSDNKDFTFTNSTKVTITCSDPEAKIYYTMAEGEGNVPDDPSEKDESQRYQGTFTIRGDITTIKAIAVRENMSPGIMEPVTLRKLDSNIKLSYKPTPFARKGEDVKNNVISKDLQKKVEADLKSTDREVISDEIGRLLYLELDMSGFINKKNLENVKYYDLLVQVKIDNNQWKEATPDDFPEGGYTVTMDYPEGTSMETNDFSIAHMFASGEDIGLVELREKKEITKTPEGLQFTLTSASPIAIAWMEAVPDGPFSNNVNDGTTDPDDPNIDNPANPDDPNNDNPASPDDPNTDNPTGTDDNGVTPRDGSNTNGTTGDGSATGGNGTNGTSGTSSAADAIRSAAATLLPKTGDTSKMVVWIVLAVACIAVIVGVQIKSKKGNGKKKH